MASDENSSELVTIAGGVELDVTFRNNGTKPERVKVHQIPISKIQDFLVSMGNENQTIELYCDKPAGWADTLTIESASAIADKGQEINLPFLNAWWRRQARWRKMQLVAMGVAESDKPTNAAASPTSVPQSPTITT